jgi:hypothetical protein
VITDGRSDYVGIVFRDLGAFRHRCHHRFLGKRREEPPKEGIPERSVLECGEPLGRDYLERVQGRICCSVVYNGSPAV